MLWTLLAIVVAGLGAAGIALLLRKLTRNKLPKWIVPLFERRARSILAKQVSDPELRAKLEPNFRIMCKRILLSNDWFPAITRPDVTVVASGPQ